MKPFDLFNNAVRAKEIAAVLMRNGFADLLQKLNPPPWLLQIFVRARSEKRTPWERIRQVAEELGPTSVKFGQLLSMRPDLVPAPLILELRKLQDRVKPEAFDLMEPVLKDELGCDIDTVFSEFNREPVAAASLAQVYFARLRRTKEPVAVKVQRPDLQRIIQSDFDILLWFARQAHQTLEDLRPYNLPGILEELKAGVEQELDFRKEARNALFFNLENATPDRVFSPRVFDEYTGPKLLVMEWVEGRRIDELEVPSEEARAVAFHGARSIFSQILICGFFHADPHGGNLMVTADGRLCFLDWGLAGQLTRRMRYLMVDLFSAFLTGDAEMVVRIAGAQPRSGGPMDRSKMEKEVMFAIRENFNPHTGQGEIGRAILRLLFIFGSNGIEVARDYSLMAKAVLSIEEAGKALDPAFDIKASFHPVLRQLQRERRGPRALARQSRRAFSTAIDRLQEFPSQLFRMMRRLEEDTFTVNFQHRGLEELDDAVNAASNKITLGVIIASLVIGSSLIITTGTKPLLFGYPLLGMVGYLLSALLGIWVIFDILWRGKHR